MKIILNLMENIQKNFFVKLIYFISRVFQSRLFYFSGPLCFGLNTVVCLHCIFIFQVSTFRENLNLNIKNRPCRFATIHVIIFYSGPSDHRDLMMEIGHNLLRCIEYENLHGAMFYSDSKSSGDISFKYRINLPNYCDCIMCVKA